MKEVLIKLYIYLLILSCNVPNSKQDNISKSKVDSSKVSSKADVNRLGVVYSSTNIMVMADTTIDKSKIYYTSSRFEPYISFEDFKVGEVYVGKKMKIDYSSNRIAREYKTVITEGYSDREANFGGHYCFISWGCGQPCSFFVLVDVIDGKVYEGLMSPLGFDFRKDSRMIIVNAPDSSGFYDDCAYCHPEIWIWDEKLKRFNEVKAR
jgi:hypothetical protein